jgi:hypothetical protein
MADFAAALGAMKRGLRVRREGWAKYGLSIGFEEGKVTWRSKAILGSQPLKEIEAVDLFATDWEHIPD